MFSRLPIPLHVVVQSTVIIIRGTCVWTGPCITASRWFTLLVYGLVVMRMKVKNRIPAVEMIMKVMNLQTLWETSLHFHLHPFCRE